MGVRTHILSEIWEIPEEYSSATYPAGKYEGKAFNEKKYILDTSIFSAAAFMWKQDRV